jgi:hypothetical protein
MAEFLQLSCFAPKLVAEEADRAERFLQGLSMEFQVQLASHELETYVGTKDFQELLNTGFDDNKTKHLMQLHINGSRQLNTQDGTNC